MKKSYATFSLFAIIAFIALAGLSSCASKHTFQSSTVVPAARGDVKVKRDGNKNYVIKVDIRNLAEVKRLQPAREAYVVWMVGEDDATKNIGQIKSSSTMISSKLKASFQTVSSTKPHKIFVTAEDDAGAMTPGSMVILTTDNF
ncbi:MAG: hypothetical protein K0Q66_899 [Chitinophagaceae bacterium]|jgi:hypothetical protein|nr:hypothetical protein [Chitinophagaceae bacterium]